MNGKNDGGSEGAGGREGGGIFPRFFGSLSPSRSRAFGLVSEWLGASLVLPPLSCPAARGVARVLASCLRSGRSLRSLLRRPLMARVLGHVIGWLVSRRGFAAVLCVSGLVSRFPPRPSRAAAIAAHIGRALRSLRLAAAATRFVGRGWLVFAVASGLVCRPVRVGGWSSCFRVGAVALSSTHHPPLCAPTPAAGWSRVASWSPLALGWSPLALIYTKYVTI